jgi:hypothetical protein
MTRPDSILLAGMDGSALILPAAVLATLTRLADRVGISDDSRGRYDAALITAPLPGPLRASWGTDPPG